MVPRLHKRGHSFKGAARYLLHDKDADSSDRVAWVETRNLATDDPDSAWRVMAATAMDQQRLKQQAGIKNTGRKSTQSVQHFSLSWHEDEAAELDRQEMLAAAESALVALGASDRQAMIICHDDEPHPHIHILMNRVSQEDGRMLSSSKEKLNLSTWAEAYEKERGKIWCDERVINNAARGRGEYTRGTPAKARHIYEDEQRQPVNDNATQRIRDAQRRKDAALAQRRRQLKQRHAQAWARLEDEHKRRISDIRQDIAQGIGREKNQVRQDFRPQWAELHHQQQADMRAFEQRENTLLGRIQNRFKSIDFGGIISGEGKGQAIGDAFGALTSRTSRLEAEKKKQQRAEEQLRLQQRQAEEEATRQQRLKEQQRMADNRRYFQAQRMQLVLDQQMQRAKHRAEWLQRNQERQQAHRHELGTAARDKPARPEQEQNTPPLRPKAPEQDNTPATRGSDLLPKGGADEKARQIEQFKQRMRERAAERQRQRDQDRGDRGR